MIKVLLIEDEQPAAEKLAMLLERSPYEIEILHTCPSVEQSIDWLNEHKADLIFCDIHLSDGNAFEIFERVPTETPVIFTTAYDQYAIEAFKQNSIDYLLKPIDEDDLVKSLEKFQKRILSPLQQIDLLEWISNFGQKTTSYKRRYLVRIGNRLESIKVADISYFYSQNKQSYLVTKEDKKFPVDQSLSQIIEELDPAVFLQVSRKIVLCIDCIQNINRVSKRIIILKVTPAPPFEIIVPEEKLGALKKWLNS